MPSRASRAPAPSSVRPGAPSWERRSETQPIASILRVTCSSTIHAARTSTPRPGCSPVNSASRLVVRRATMGDLPALGPLIAASARELSRDDYTPEQVEGALKGAFGTDTQLIRDGSYFVIEVDG